VPFAVNGALATPLAFVATVIVVVLLLNAPLAPEPGALNVTFTPETGLFEASFTVTASGLVNAVLTAVLCGVVPALAVMTLAAPAELVRLKFTVVRLAAAAVTVYGPPEVPFAVNGALAIPLAFVATVMVVVPLLNAPLAPEPGALKVTFTPEIGLFEASLTVTASGLPNAVFTATLCGVVPALAVMELAAPALFVKLKFTVVRPADAAVAK
jgi:hypothetical protein